MTRTSLGQLTWMSACRYSSAALARTNLRYGANLRRLGHTLLDVFEHSPWHLCVLSFRASQSRVNEFMTHDTNSDAEISFAEFMAMTKKSDMASTGSHPGFKLSAGMIETTRKEHARLLKQIAGESR